MQRKGEREGIRGARGRRGREAAPTSSCQFTSRNRGFTLIELMVVLMILAMIAGLVYTNVIKQVDPAKAKTAKAQIEILGLALDNFRLDTGQYPAALRELQESSAQGWKGPYLRKDIPKDPWGNDYVYELVEDGNNYHLSSTGGGKEPINSWE